MTDPEAVLSSIISALNDLEAGHQPDCRALRALIVAGGDQLGASVVDERAPEADRAASRHLEVVNVGFLAVVDRLEAGDLDGARRALRDAFWAPTGRPAPDEPPV